MRTEQVNFQYRATRPIFENLNLSLQSNAITTIIGPNGCGKSTLLQLLSYNLTPQHGVVYLNEQSLNDFSQKQLAQRLATVHQQSQIPDDFTVRQMIETGRYSYQGLFAKDTNKDEVVSQVIEQLNLQAFENEPVKALSGGERQRVHLGVALAQEPEYLLLDEPTTYLDLHYQYQVLDIVKELQHTYQLTVVMVLHDINQAIEYSDELICLAPGRVLAQGAPKDVITTVLIKEMYHIDAKIFHDEACGTMICRKRGDRRC